MSLPETPFWGPDFDALQAEDPEIADVVLGELDRLRGGLQLIASENFTSPAVLAALGSTLSNKYAEGYPGRRYYGGCQEVDRAEELGIAERARRSSAPGRRTRQPPAALGRERQPRGLRRAAAARRHRARDVAAARRPPDPRLEGQLLRHLVHAGVLHGPPGHRADRLRRGARPRPRAPAEDDHRGRDGLPAADRLRRGSARSPTRSVPG